MSENNLLQLIAATYAKHSEPEVMVRFKFDRDIYPFTVVRRGTVATVVRDRMDGNFFSVQLDRGRNPSEFEALADWEGQVCFSLTDDPKGELEWISTGLEVVEGYDA